MFKNLLKNAAISTIDWIIVAGQIIGQLLFNKRSKYNLKFCLVLSLNLTVASTAFAQLPVSASRPRIFLDATTKTAMMAKKNNNDANWVAVLADANKYLPKQVIAWDPVSASDSQYYGTGDIFYSYCGSSWEEAAITLGMAHQLTKTNNAGANATAYSNKLMALADVVIKGYADYPANTNYQPNIFQFNSSYATRHVGKAIAIIYDWCYDELGATRKAKLLNVMKDWFTFMSTHPYMLNQLQDDPTGNYFIGHVICAAYMGYAIGSDDPSSQKMIEFSRQRILGTPGSLANDSPTSAEKAHAYFTQSVKGGLPSGASKSYLGPTTILGAPQQDGIPVRGWSYGGETGNFIIDYCFLVKSATGESMIQTDAAFKQYFTKNSEALIHSYTPNRFQYDNSNDNGSFLGCTSSYGLPLRLSALLEGTPEGGNIEYFYRNVLQPPNLLSLNKGYQALCWEKLLYDKPRTATPYNFKPYYPIPVVNTYNAVQQNSSLNKFYIRSNWSASATWAAVEMGTATYDQHNHNNAGHFKIIRGDSHDGDDHLLVAANEVAKAGGNGIDGPTNYSFSSSLSNTLFINDFNDFDPAYPDYPNTMGGQTSAGYDEPTNQEQNDNFSYFRSDLTSAYFMSYYVPDTTQRTVRYYYRSLLYLRNSNIFVSYDKFQAKNSTNVKGQYKKHLRWHFLNQPVISGNNITATNDNSKLFIHTVIPAATSIVKVDESNNPDNTFGSGYNYVFNTNTWRAEVGAVNNPLKQDIVTVLQPGAKAAAEMATTAMATSQNNMEGSLITVNGNTEVVLFNNSIAKYPVPVSAATYAYTGPITGRHTLCGLDPGKKYAVAYNGATVTVAKSAAGTETASPSGVLSFSLQAPVQSANANLVKLTCSNSLLSPAFTASTTSYTALVGNGIATVTFKPTVADATASVTINGVAVVSGIASQPIAMAVGANEVTVIVTAQNAVTKTYKVTVTRKASSNAVLSSIVTNPVAARVATTGPADYNSAITVEYSTSSISIAATPQDTNATIKIKGVAVAAGAFSAPIPLGVTTLINIVVFAQDGTTIKTYAITVNRKLPSSVATLSSIITNPATKLVNTTGPADYNRTVSVSAGVNNITFAATPHNANATIQVNGVTVPAGVASALISLTGTATLVTILVTAEDGKTKKTYEVTVNRPAPLALAWAGNKHVDVLQPNQVDDKAAQQELTVRQGLSPNGDGMNDSFVIEGINAYPDNKVSIMNRNGGLVYEARGYDNNNRPFDGRTTGGAQLQAGTYFYSIEYKAGDTVKRKSGYLVIKY
jgi:gliding motility-associated-like protein